MYIYIYIYIYTNLPVNVIVRLLHPWSRDSQGQEAFLAPPADKQTHNCDTKCSNHHPSIYIILFINITYMQLIRACIHVLMIK